MKDMVVVHGNIMRIYPLVIQHSYGRAHVLYR